MRLRVIDYHIPRLSLLQMKVKKNSLLRKVKKICRAIAKEDEDETDESDCEIKVGVANEIMFVAR